MRRWGVIAGVGVLAASFALPVPAAGAADLATVHVGLQPVATGLNLPTAVAWRAGDAQMYVAQQGGRLKTVVNGTTRTS
jgi:ABC-type nitrate/sulfonate/bicarbonate transport system substrate-binding protein